MHLMQCGLNDSECKGEEFKRVECLGGGVEP